MTSNIERDYFVIVSIILLIASIVLLAYCSYDTVVIFSKDNLFGLAEELKISYWLGLALIIASLLLLISSNVKYNKHEKLFLLEVCFFAVYLYSIPSLVEESVYFPDTWMHSSSSTSILIYGKYDQPLDWYASVFPGAFIFQSIALLITNVDPIILMKYHPALFSILLVLTSYILLRKLLSDTRMIYLATIFLVSGSVWVFPKHFCPNSFALIWYLLIFFLVFSRKTIKTIALCIFLGIVTIVSHPVTLPFLIFSILSILTGFALSRRFRILEKQRTLQRHWNLSYAFVLFLIVSWLTWLMFNATDIMISLVDTTGRFFASLHEYLTWERPAERLLMTSPYLHLGQMLKITYSLLYGFAGATGTSYLILKRYKKEHARAFAALSWIMACFVVGLTSAFLHGGEFFERPLVYGFVPLSALAAVGYKNRYGKVILISTLLIGAPLSVFAAYSNEYFEYSPISNSYGATFMVNHNITDMGNVNAIDPTYLVVRFHVLRGYFEHDADPESLSSSKNTIFVWSRTSERYYSIYLKGRVYTPIEEFWPNFSWIENYSNMISQPGFNLIYNNEESQLLFVQKALITNSS